MRIVANFGVEGQITQKVDFMLFADILDRAAGAEDGRVAMAVGTAEDGHVLHQSQDGHIDLLEHVDALDRVFDRKDVWYGDYNGP